MPSDDELSDTQKGLGTRECPTAVFHALDYPIDVLEMLEDKASDLRVRI